MLYADHLFVLIVAVVYPIAGFFGYQRLLRRMQAGVPPNRSTMYRNTLIGQWSLVVLLAYLWTATDRTTADLGLDLSLDVAFMIAVVITLVCIAALAAQMVVVLRAGQDTANRISDGFGRVEMLVPHNDREMTQFYWVSVSAGIVEELMWRGYLMWYLTHYFSVAVSAVIVIVAFGVAHGYQGWRNIPKITLVGAAFTGLYLLSGSIWLSMLLHMAVDAMQGRLACEVIQRRSPQVRQPN